MVRNAREHLPPNRPPSGIHLWEKRLKDQGPIRLSIGFFALIVIGAAISIAMIHWPWALLTQFAPHQPDLDLATLWQVYAALVTVALPVFLVVVQFSNDLKGEISALPVTEVLVSEVGVRPILVLAGFGIIHCGVDAFWLHSQAVLVVDFYFVFIPTILVLGYSIFRLYFYIGARDVLAARAVALLQWKVRSLVDEATATAGGNDQLLKELAESPTVTVQYLPLDLLHLKHDPAWLPIGPTAEERIADVNSTNLARIISNIPLATPPITEQSVANPTPSAEAAADIYLRRICGQTIGPNEPFLLLRRSAFQTLNADSLWTELSSWIEPYEVA